MEQCEFCDEEFENEIDLHVHWGEEHEDELNSHQTDKVKKAERKKEGREKKERERKKNLAFKVLASGLALVLAAILIPQMLNSVSDGDGKGNGAVQRANFSLEDEPMLGNASADVRVVEFGDYKCPVCKMFESRIFPKIKSNYIETGKISFYFRNFAFLNTAGDSSTTAAVAGECVYRQNETEFWDFHKAVYENQGPERQDWATKQKLMEIARESTDGLDYDSLNKCISQKQTLDEVSSDKQTGIDAGVTGTPTVYVNGKKAPSYQYSTIRAMIEEELSN